MIHIDDSPLVSSVKDNQDIKPMKLSSYLKRLKGNRKHKEVAEILGINSTSYNAILNGKKDKYISPTVTANLCRIFGIDPDDLHYFKYVLAEDVIEDIKQRNLGFNYSKRQEEIYNALNINPKERNKRNEKNNKLEATLPVETKIDIRRRVDMKELRDYNFTLVEIASLYDLTRERIRQLIEKMSNSYLERDLSFEGKTFFNGSLYDTKTDIYNKFFPNLDKEYVDSSIRSFIMATGQSFNVAANYYYFKLNQRENDFSKVFYRYKKYRGMNEFSNAIFPEENPDKVKDYIIDIINSLGYDFESAVDYLLTSIDLFKYDTKVKIDGIEYESKIDAIRQLFPDYDEDKVRSCINQRMKKMSFEEALKYTIENPPKEKEPFVYKRKVYPSKIEAIANIFPDRDPQNTYYSINSYMNDHNCSFEKAVDAIKKYGYKNKRVAVSYRGKKYNSIRELCRDYDVTIQALNGYMKRHHITIKTAMDRILDSRSVREDTVGEESLKSLGLSEEVVILLNNAGVYTREDLSALGWGDLDKISGLSRSSVREIMAIKKANKLVKK